MFGTANDSVEKCMECPSSELMISQVQQEAGEDKKTVRFFSCGINCCSEVLVLLDHK